MAMRPSDCRGMPEMISVSAGVHTLQCLLLGKSGNSGLSNTLALASDASVPTNPVFPITQSHVKINGMLIPEYHPMVFVSGSINQGV